MKQKGIKIMMGMVLLTTLSSAGASTQRCRDPARQDKPMLLETTAANQSAQLRFTPLDEQRVLDRQTGLEWQRCSMGLSGAQCQQGRLDRYSLPGVMGLMAQIRRQGWAGHTDWRLPSREELASLLKPDCVNPAIDTSAFPNTPTSSFWSATGQAAAHYYVDFKDGHSEQEDINLANPIRLVRTPELTH